MPRLTSLAPQTPALAPVAAFTHGAPIPASFGAGCSSEGAGLFASWGARQVLLLTDPGVAGAGLVAPMEQALRAAGIGVVRFDAIQPNPRLADVEAAHRLWTASGADALLAVGGGSVLDSAKVLAATVACDAPAEQVILDPDRLMRRAPARLVAVPTTAGTGSESTTAALIKDHRGRKRVMRSLRARPAHILLDPALTLSVPPGMTAAAGWDVVMHALGALGTTQRSVDADACAFEALARACHALPRAVANGADLDARAQMLHASYLAGRAIAGNGVDAIHGLCTPLESLVDRAHGHVLGVTFGPVVRANLPALTERYAQAARRCGLADARTDDGSAARALVEMLERLRDDLGLPARLRELGIDAAMLAEMPEGALASRATQVNVVPLARERIAALYRAML